MATITANKLTLILAVKAHANEHYEEGGWDYVAEGSYDDEELLEIIGESWTAQGAIRKVGKVLADHSAHAHDIQGA